MRTAEEYTLTGRQPAPRERFPAGNATAAGLSNFAGMQSARNLLRTAAMMMMNKWIMGALAVGVLAASGDISVKSAGAASTATSTPVNVNVTNVPLPVTGTMTATVAGSVAASQAGAWNVGITGTPTVAVVLPATKPFRWSACHTSTSDTATIKNETQDLLVIDAVQATDVSNSYPVRVAQVTVAKPLVYEDAASGYTEHAANALTKIYLFPGEQTNVIGSGCPIKLVGHYEGYQP